MVKPEERLRPLRDLPPSHNAKSLKGTFGLFAYYAKWFKEFSDKIEPLKKATLFFLQLEVFQNFESLKQDIANASLSSIDEEQPFVVECVW